MPHIPIMAHTPSTSHTSCTDLRLILSDGEMNVHAHQLTKVSPYFRAMFRNKFQEHMSSTVQLPVFNVATMNVLMEYVYTGTVDHYNDNMIEVLMMADYFQIIPLAKLCCLSIKRHVTPATIVHAYELAVALGYHDMARWLLAYAVHHLSSVVAGSEWCAATAATVKQVVRHYSVSKDLSTQQHVVQAVRRWAEEDPGRRWSAVTGLLTLAETSLLLHSCPTVAALITLPTTTDSSAAITVRPTACATTTTISPSFDVFGQHFHHNGFHDGNDTDDGFDEIRLAGHFETVEVVFAMGGEQCGHLTESGECFINNKWSFINKLADLSGCLASRNIEAEQRLVAQYAPAPTTNCRHNTHSDNTKHKLANQPPDYMNTTTSSCHLHKQLRDKIFQTSDQQKNTATNNTLLASYNVKDPKLNQLLNNAHKTRVKLLDGMVQRGEDSFRNPSKNSFDVILKEAMPRKFGAVAHMERDDTFFILGGRGRNGLVASVHEFHVTSNTWTQHCDLPLPVTAGVAAAIDDRVYYAGGATDHRYLDSLWRLQSGGGRWESLARLPSGGRCHAAAAALNGAFYLTGGTARTDGDGEGGNDDIGEDDGGGGVTYLQDCLKYEHVTDEWSTIADMLEPRAYHGTAVLDDRLYVIGGYNGVYWLSSAERYDPVTDTWTALPPMMSPRSSMGVCAVAGRGEVMVCGGYTGHRPTNTVESFSGRTTQSWQPRPNMRADRIGAVAVTLTMNHWITTTQDNYQHLSLL